jgi:cation transport ATPase
MFFAIVAPIVLLVFAGVGVTLLLWPSAWLRRSRNPWQPYTPENRLHMRSLGQMVCLFMLLIVSGLFGSGATAEGFHRNVLVALWTSFLFVPVFVWILWRTSLRGVARRLLTGELDEEKWELWMSLAFSGLLTSMIMTAFILALNGYYPPQKQVY